AHGMWEVAERIAKDGSLDIHTRWPEDIPPGRDGKTYCISPLGPSIVHLPGAAIVYLLHRAAPAYDKLVKPLATHLAPAALGALACSLFFMLLVELGARKKTASVCTAILAVATTTWVYARYPYSEILQMTCFLGLFRQTLRVLDKPDRREALWLGAWAGVLLNAKYVLALPIAGAALLIVWTLRRNRKELARVVGWAAVAGVPLVLVACAYNYARWESVTSSGYEGYLAPYFGGRYFDGLWGMLLSPNKSAFVYSPPLVLAVIGLPHVIRTQRKFGLALLAMACPLFLLYCQYKTWSGDYAWGPRFFVWLLPVVLVGLYGFWDGVAARWRPRVRIAILGSVVALGIGVQVMGNALYWDHFIRVSIDVKNQWLGNPNRSGAYLAERGRGHCDSCLEDTYQLLWLPAFQPVLGHWWLVKSIVAGDDEREAQKSAPWRTYTTLDMNLAATYPRARFDWWGLLWLKDARETWVAGLVLLVVMLGATLLGTVMWIRLHRAAVDP
ncbi:MAG: rane protein of unknown function, partial [Myxococcales bacterium]|nr:rane protein of unknown function [Myxococcales bacterium]